MSDPLDRFNRVWAEFVAETPRFTTEILGAFDEAGALTDHDGYDRAVCEMGETGAISATLMTWAGILAATHADTDDPLAPNLDFIGDPAWRNPAHQHGRALIATIRDAAGSPNGYQQIFARLDRINQKMGDDIWFLIGLLAKSTAPVLRTLGGMDRFGEIADLVTDLAAEQNLHAAGPPVTAGLAAIDTGHLDAARSYLALIHPDATIAVLLAALHRLAQGRKAATMIGLDVDGVPESMGVPDSASHALLWDLVNAILSADRAQFAAMKDRFAAAALEDKIEMAWVLSLTVAHQLPDRTHAP